MLKTLLKFINFILERYLHIKIIKVQKNIWRLPKIDDFIENIGKYKDEFTYFSNLREEQYWTKNYSENITNGWAISLDKNFLTGYYLLEIDKNYENTIVFVKNDFNGELEWTKPLGTMDYKNALNLLSKFNQKI